MTVRYEVFDGVAIVTLDNPPVNSLGFATRRGLVEVRTISARAILQRAMTDL
jgi:3-hydroxyacyl-CoA dehydrogenase